MSLFLSVFFTCRMSFNGANRLPIRRGYQQGITDERSSPQEKPYSISPPLATDFFKQCLRHPYVLDYPEQHWEECKELYDYIERYWKLGFDDLKESTFDLEECYTLIQQQKRQAESDVEAYRRQDVIEQQLTALLQGFLNHFQRDIDDLDLLSLGGLILAERAAVLTFNYDTIVERAIETVSNHRERKAQPDLADLANSLHVWNRSLAYGFQFDEVENHGIGHTDVFVGEDFYSHSENRLYDTPLLKLHGSLNWLTYTNLQETSVSRFVINNEREGKTRIARSNFSCYWNLIPGNLNYHPAKSDDGFILKPLLVTPVMYKDLSEWPFSEIWRRAKKELTECKRLVVGGYSFPPTDFATRRLFLESFADNSLDELIVINPDTRIVGLVKDLCHFKSPVLVYQNLDEFLRRFAEKRHRWGMVEPGHRE